MNAACTGATTIDVTEVLWKVIGEARIAEKDQRLQLAVITLATAGFSASVKLSAIVAHAVALADIH